MSYIVMRDDSGSEVIAASVTGSSHVRVGKPCQDAFKLAAGMSAEGAWTAAAVADGHGSAAYIHSNIGATNACQAALLVLEHAIKRFDGEFEEVRTYFDSDYMRDVLDVWLLLCRHHFEGLIRSVPDSAIVPDSAESSVWGGAEIDEFAEEMLSEQKDDIDVSAQGSADEGRNISTDSIEDVSGTPRFDLRLYGTTLSVAMVLGDHGFFCRIGDSDIAIAEEGAVPSLVFSDDEDVVGCETHSLCSRNALRNVERIVLAATQCRSIFLSTDGLRNSYNEEEKFTRFIGNVGKQSRQFGGDALGKILPEALSKISGSGSGDDITLVAVLNDSVRHMTEFTSNQTS